MPCYQCIRFVLLALLLLALLFDEMFPECWWYCYCCCAFFKLLDITVLRVFFVLALLASPLQRSPYGFFCLGQRSGDMRTVLRLRVSNSKACGKNFSGNTHRSSHGFVGCWELGNHSAVGSGFAILGISKKIRVLNNTQQENSQHPMKTHHVQKLPFRDCRFVGHGASCCRFWG